MYTKDFGGWGVDKKSTHLAASAVLYPKERQVWYAKRGVNIGFESDGKNSYLRPVLVMKRIGSLYFCVPLTTKHKDNSFHFQLDFDTFGKISSVMLSQARIVDVKRFSDHMGMVNQENFTDIKNLMRDMYLP